MHSTLLDHPSLEELRQFALGRLAAGEAERVGTHIENCSACCDRLTQCGKEEDSLAQWVQHVGHPTPTPTPTPMPEHGALGVPTMLGIPGSGPAPPPSLLGRYEILGELGRGGMGVVYKARDTQLKRLVAIKMIQQEGVDRDTLARFQAEGLAVARLRHPHIVQLLEVGDEHGTPYQVLEYLDGGSLAEHSQGQPQDVAYAARMVQTLAEAVEHAHSQGVIHRDLKPANVLLTAEGVAKVTDFGLVKFDRHLLTETLPLADTSTGCIVGTPLYMSPEQARGVPGTIGPSTDIYALGAILYYLLTGRAPFAEIANPLDVLQALQDREPSTPRSHRPDLPRDLEVICLKCLAMEPYRRYTSAGELAAELGRFLRGEPILARPLSWRQKTSRWCRRNPVVAGLLGGLLLVITASLVGLTWLYLDADEQRRYAQQKEQEARTSAQEAIQQRLAVERQREETDRQREDALGYFDIARQAVETFHSRVMKDAKLKENDFHPLRTALLESTIRFHEALIRRRSSDPRLQAAQGRAWRQLGVLQQELGQYDAALKAFAQAVAVLTPLATHPRLRGPVLRDLGGAQQYRALLLGKMGQWEEAHAGFRAALPVLEELARDFSQDHDNLFNLLAYWGNYSRVLADQGRATEAMQLLQDKLPALETLVAKTPTPLIRAGLAALLHNLGCQYMDRRQLEAALPPLQRSYELFAALVQEMGNDPRFRYGLVQACGNLGRLLEERGQIEASLKVLTEGEQRNAELVRTHAQVVDYRQNWGCLCYHLGTLHRRQRHWAKAVAAYDVALRELTTVRSRAPRLRETVSFLANTHYGRADALEQMNRDEEALVDWQKGHALAPDPDGALRLAHALVRKGQVEEGTAVLAASLSPQAPASLRFDQASVLALAAVKSADQPMVAQQHLQGALRLLHELAATGYFQRQPAAAQALSTRPDFAAVRQHPDYARLLAPPDKTP